MESGKNTVHENMQESPEPEEFYDEDDDLELLTDDGWNPEAILNEWKHNTSLKYGITEDYLHSSVKTDSYTKNLQDNYHSFKDDLLSGMEEYRKDVGMNPGEYRTENKWEGMESLDDLQFDDSLLDETHAISTDQVREKRYASAGTASSVEEKPVREIPLEENRGKNGNLSDEATEGREKGDLSAEKETASREKYDLSADKKSEGEETAESGTLTREIPIEKVQNRRNAIEDPQSSGYAASDKTGGSEEALSGDAAEKAGGLEEVLSAGAAEKSGSPADDLTGNVVKTGGKSPAEEDSTSDGREASGSKEASENRGASDGREAADSRDVSGAGTRASDREDSSEAEALAAGATRVINADEVKKAMRQAVEATRVIHPEEIRAAMEDMKRRSREERRSVKPEQQNENAGEYEEQLWTADAEQEERARSRSSFYEDEITAEWADEDDFSDEDYDPPRRARRVVIPVVILVIIIAAVFIYLRNPF